MRKTTIHSDNSIDWIESFKTVLAMVAPLHNQNRTQTFLQHDFTQQSLRHLQLWNNTWASNPISWATWLIWLSPIHTFHRTRWRICLSRPKISNMTDIFLSALRGKILRKTPPHTRGNSWTNCLARQFAKLFPPVGLSVQLFLFRCHSIRPAGVFFPEQIECPLLPDSRKLLDLTTGVRRKVEICIVFISSRNALCKQSLKKAVSRDSGHSLTFAEIFHHPAAFRFLASSGRRALSSPTATTIDTPTPNILQGTLIKRMEVLIYIRTFTLVTYTILLGPHIQGIEYS